MLTTPGNPQGLPIEVFDGIRKGTVDNRSPYLKDLAVPFFGYNRSGAKISQGVIDSFWQQGMLGGIKGLYDCSHEFSAVDFTEDLKKTRTSSPSYKARHRLRLGARRSQ